MDIGDLLIFASFATIVGIVAFPIGFISAAVSLKRAARERAYTFGIMLPWMLYAGMIIFQIYQAVRV